MTSRYRASSAKRLPTGFEPAIGPSGEKPVTLLRGGHTRYCALLTDINLRGTMDGWKVAKKGREIDPAFPIIYITGRGG
jgi:DNA-binding LytR/AlgR family response regulator